MHNCPLPWEPCLNLVLQVVCLEEGTSRKGGKPEGPRPLLTVPTLGPLGPGTIMVTGLKPPAKWLLPPGYQPAIPWLTAPNPVPGKRDLSKGWWHRTISLFANSYGGHRKWGHRPWSHRPGFESWFFPLQAYFLIYKMGVWTGATSLEDMGVDEIRHREHSAQGQVHSRASGMSCCCDISWDWGLVSPSPSGNQVSSEQR